MAQKLDQGMIMTALDYCYNKAINGLPGVDTAEKLAREYMDGEGNLKSKAESLVRCSGVRGTLVRSLSYSEANRDDGTGCVT